MPLNEECQYPNISFQAILGAREEGHSEDEDVLSDIHNNDLPKEAVIIQANVKDAIEFKYLVLSESPSVFPYLRNDKKRKEDAPDQDQREGDGELKDEVDSIPALNASVLPQIVLPVLVFDASKKGEAVVYNCGLPNQEDDEESSHEASSQGELCPYIRIHSAR